VAVYKKILVPLDHSRADAAALSHAGKIARFSGAQLILVHVADGHAARNQQALNLQDSPEIEEDRAYLQERERELAAAGARVGIIIERGDPTSRLLNVIARESPDLIIMGTHGHGIVGDLLRGSVAEQLRHKTHVPILMVRDPLEQA
jgi:nucleotide-binding universal stress UspA family protein